MSFGRRKIPKHLIIDENYRQPRSNGAGLLAAAAAILLIGMLLSVYATANADFYEAKSGQLLFKSDTGHYADALHLKSNAKVEISGLVAHVTFTQTFSNQTDHWREGVYVFPLPENAAVNHMEMRIGERFIVGEIKEKQTARKIYAAAKKAGKRAALTEQQRPNIFTQRVANIPPGETISVSITYLHSTRFDNGEFSWRLPTTITPRYFPPSDKNMSAEKESLKKNTFDEEYNHTPDHSAFLKPSEGWATMDALSLDTMPLPASVHQFSSHTPSHKLTLNIELNSGLPLSNINALFHDINISKSGDTHSISLVDGKTTMDRDFVLSWRPAASRTPQAALFSEEVDNEMYSLLMILPPQKKSPDVALARDIVFVIDVSGSMGGESIKQAKAGLAKALQQLTSQDRFNVIAFSSDFHSFFLNQVYADTHNIRQAINKTAQLSANGGTNMLPALNHAMNQLEDTRRLQQIVFITDGAVGNETALFKTIHNKLGDTRLFTVGIGAAPNSYFMKKAAEFGRGSFTYIGNIKSVNQKISQLFEKLSSAVATGITLNWPEANISYPSRIPDLYMSEPLIISSRSSSLQGDLEIEGMLAGSPWRQRISLNQARNNRGVSTLWARAKIEDLEDLKITGADADVIKEEITSVALRHKLLSAYTSFVAVEKQPVRQADIPLRATPIQNTLPKGHSASKTNVPWPQTATNASMTWWLGLFCLVVIVFVRCIFRE